MKWKFCAPLLFALILLTAVLSPLLFSQQALSAGDAPLWSLAYQKTLFPSLFTGYWENLFFLGHAVSAPPPVPQRLLMPLCTPAFFIKWMLFSNVLFTAAAAWCWLRLQGRSSLAATSAAIALALAGHYFTLISAGHLGKLVMLPFMTAALACIEYGFRRRSLIAFGWCGVCLAAALTEQPDVTIMIGGLAVALMLFHAFRPGTASPVHKRIRFLLSGSAIAALFFGLTAAPALVSQFGSQVRESAPGSGNETSKQAQWNWATQWSLPPEDTLEMFVPAPFGIKTGDSRLPYWGRQGRSPDWEETSQGFRNFRQEEQYAGIVFLFFALTALTGLRRKNNLRPELIFWTAVTGLFWLLALGKYGPLYRFFYQLPLMGHLRNPVKMMFGLQLGLTALAGFGVDAVLEKIKAGQGKRLLQVAAVLSLALLLAAGLCWLARPAIMAALASAGWTEFSQALTNNLALAFLYAGLALLAATGWMAGLRRFRVTPYLLLLPVLIAVDNGIIVMRHLDYYDPQGMHQPNDLIDFLKQHEGRLKILGHHPLFSYWSNALLPYHEIQQIDVLAESRMPADKAFFMQALREHPLRFWQMTSTRFFLTDQATWNTLRNDPRWSAFWKPVYPFSLRQNGAALETVKTTPAEAPFLLLELPDALPRAALYSYWEIPPDPKAFAARLAGPAFDPAKTVLLESPPACERPATTEPGETIALTSAEYTPHRISFELPPQSQPTVLLLNERWHKNWQARVDGKPTPILRANGIMRAIRIPPGSQHLEFRYQPDKKPLVAAAGALTILILLSFQNRIRQKGARR